MHERAREMHKSKTELMAVKMVVASARLRQRRAAEHGDGGGEIGEKKITAAVARAL
jgi:hypothetical protein